MTPDFADHSVLWFIERGCIDGNVHCNPKDVLAATCNPRLNQYEESICDITEFFDLNGVADCYTGDFKEGDLNGEICIYISEDPEQFKYTWDYPKGS